MESTLGEGDSASDSSKLLALMLSSAVNTNGKALSLTAPNGAAQQVLLRKALTVGGLQPGDVDGLHTHSNGTVLETPLKSAAWQL